MMARFAALLLAALAIGGCRGDETLHAYGAADKTWRLVELRGTPFAAQAMITFPEPGQISGRGPCNRFNATQNVPYPWFEAGPIAATRMACPALADEAAFLTALSEASLSEVAGDTLILSDEENVLLVFKAGG